jgi:hypothetical protein
MIEAGIPPHRNPCHRCKRFIELALIRFDWEKDRPEQQEHMRHSPCAIHTYSADQRDAKEENDGRISARVIDRNRNRDRDIHDMLLRNQLDCSFDLYSVANYQLASSSSSSSSSSHQSRNKLLSPHHKKGPEEDKAPHGPLLCKTLQTWQEEKRINSRQASCQIRFLDKTTSSFARL